MGPPSDAKGSGSSSSSQASAGGSDYQHWIPGYIRCSLLSPCACVGSDGVFVGVLVGQWLLQALCSARGSDHQHLMPEWVVGVCACVRVYLRGEAV